MISQTDCITGHIRYLFAQTSSMPYQLLLAGSIKRNIDRVVYLGVHPKSFSHKNLKILYFCIVGPIPSLRKSDKGFTGLKCKSNTGIPFYLSL